MTYAAGGKHIWNRGDEDGRRQGALRLFGALSGVDEDYLAACEDDPGAPAGGKGRRKAAERAGESRQESSGAVRFIWKHGRAIAAVVCVAVLGVSYLGIRLGIASGGSGKFAGGADNNSASVAEDKAVPESTAAQGFGGNGRDTAQLAEPAEQADGGYSDNAKQKSDMNQIQELQQESEKELDTDLESPISSLSEEMLQDDMAAVQIRHTYNEISFEAAKSVDVVGVYLPTVWPADGKMENVSESGQPGEESVRVTWTYGNQWDSFVLTVTNLGTALPEWVEAATADVSEPEAYDESLYEIPYGESVPGEYHTVFQDPVFKQEDFSRECVAARISSNVGDSGDTDTPRGNFSVLYQAEDGNYVLVKFRGRGTVDEVWRVMHSISNTEWMKPPAP